ncbi:hypothetical protein TNCV_603681 [Trichonephila clavipes]|nr:hypothetical protein TNCV_603681 [Trichonephila clavipes]
MPSEQQGRSPEKEKDLRRPLEPENVERVVRIRLDSTLDPKIECVCKFGQVCENDPTIRTSIQEKDLDNVWLQQDGATPRISRVYVDVLIAV